MSHVLIKNRKYYVNVNFKYKMQENSLEISGELHKDSLHVFVTACVLLSLYSSS